jgi:hypothetical protein
VRVNAPKSLNGSVVVPVTFVVRDKAGLLVRPSKLNFSFQVGDTWERPASQTLLVTGGAANFAVQTTTRGGPAWLKVDVQEAKTPARIEVSVDTWSMNPGVYTGSVDLLTTDTPPVFYRVPVTLSITEQTQITVSPPQLTFEAPEGSRIPLSQVLRVYTNGDVARFRVTPSFHNWLGADTQGSAGTIEVSGGYVRNTPAMINVRVNPTGLAAGVHEGSVTLKLRDEDETTVPVRLHIRRSLVLPQIADGGQWKSTILLINLANSQAPYTVKFWTPQGKPMTLPITGETGHVTEVAGDIPAGGMQTIETEGISPDLLQGWAEVVSAFPIGCRVVFRQRSLLGFEHEAAVPAVVPLGKTLNLPFDTAEGSDTAFALVNAADSETPLKITLRNESGRLLSSETLTLAGRHRLAFSFAERFPSFVGDRGVIEFAAADHDIAALGLRFATPGSFTYLEPVAAGVTSQDNTTRWIPSIMDGGGWRTSFVLVNPTPAPAPFSLGVRQVDGSPLALPFSRSSVDSEYSDVIPPHGARFFQTMGDLAKLSQGWAELVVPDSVGAAIVVRRSSPNGQDGEGTITLLPLTADRAVFPFDNLEGNAGAAAILNPDVAQNRVAVFSFRDESGVLFHTTRMSILPNTREWLTLPESFPESRGRRGSVEIFSPGTLSFGQRFIGLDSFTMMAPIFK